MPYEVYEKMIQSVRTYLNLSSGGTLSILMQGVER
jgi:hypothetical protein